MQIKTTKKKITKKKVPSRIVRQGIKIAVSKKSALKKPLPNKKTAVVKVKTYPSKGYLEEYQVTGFHYAFLSSPTDGNRMCHWWVKCRDFLQDALRNQLTGRVDGIYSFRYDPKQDPPIDTARTRMLVKRVPKPDTSKAVKEFDEMMRSALKLVNYYETKYNLTPKSKLVPVEQKDNPVLFVGPGVWSKGPVMIGLYTFLIRLGYWKYNFTQKNGPEEAFKKIMSTSDNKITNDVRYLKTVHPIIDKILVHRDLHLFKQKGTDKIRFADIPINRFHHHSGPISLANSFCDQTVKQKFNAAK